VRLRPLQFQNVGRRADRGDFPAAHRDRFGGAELGVNRQHLAVVNDEVRGHVRLCAEGLNCGTQEKCHGKKGGLHGELQFTSRKRLRKQGDFAPLAEYYTHDHNLSTAGIQESFTLSGTETA